MAQSFAVASGVIAARRASLLSLALFAALFSAGCTGEATPPDMTPPGTGSGGGQSAGMGSGTGASPDPSPGGGPAPSNPGDPMTMDPNPNTTPPPGTADPANPGSMPMPETPPPNSVDGPVPEPHVCTLELEDIAFYQAVQIPLLRDGELVEERNAPIVAGRQAIFQAFLRFAQTPKAANVGGTLTLTSSAGMHSVKVRLSLDKDSVEDDPASTLNFKVPAEHIHADTKAQIELDLGATCPGGGKSKIPAAEPLALEAVETGTLNIKFVPIVYQADGSDRAPDVSQKQMKDFGDLLQAMYPTKDVNIELAQPVEAGELTVSRGGGGWNSLVNGLRGLRQDENLGSDWHYYGLITPASSFRSYCGMGCVAGLSFRPTRPSAAQQVSVGVGYTGEIASETMAHELGHQHGYGHSPSPCGGASPDGVDRNFPYDNGSIGVQGVDFRSDSLIPKAYKDMMGYCRPTWISDYTYSALARRRIEVNRLAKVIQAHERTLEVPLQSAVVSPDGALSLGHVVKPGQRPVGEPESARILNAAGQVIAEVTVYRADFEHGAGFAIDLPMLEPDWAFLELAGSAPIALEGRPVLPRLRPVSAGRNANPDPLRLP